MRLVSPALTADEHTMAWWLSHELKTPFTAIKLCATALLSDTLTPGRDPEVSRQLAESIDRENDRLTRLVSSLLDMSRIEAGALCPQLEWVPIIVSSTKYWIRWSRPVIFCVDDVRSRSVKRVATAIGEGSMAVRLVFESPPAVWCPLRFG